MGELRPGRGRLPAAGRAHQPRGEPGRSGPAFLERRGVAIAFGQRLRAVGLEHDRAGWLDFGQRRIELGPGDQVVLALPPGQTATLLPGIEVPHASHAIVNGHFRLARPASLPGGALLLGLVGGTAEWLFVRDELVSLTVSAADALADEPSEVGGGAPVGGHRGGARPARTAAAAGAHRQGAPRHLRPDARAGRQATPCRDPWSNLLLAGDWTATGLPATIEGAIRSGDVAADLVVKQTETKTR